MLLLLLFFHFSLSLWVDYFPGTSALPITDENGELCFTKSGNFYFYRCYFIDLECYVLAILSNELSNILIEQCTVINCTHDNQGVFYIEKGSIVITQTCLSKIDNESQEKYYNTNQIICYLYKCPIFKQFYTQICENNPYLAKGGTVLFLGVNTNINIKYVNYSYNRCTNVGFYMPRTDLNEQGTTESSIEYCHFYRNTILVGENDESIMGFFAIDRQDVKVSFSHVNFIDPIWVVDSYPEQKLYILSMNSAANFNKCSFTGLREVHIKISSNPVKLTNCYIENVVFEGGQPIINDPASLSFINEIEEIKVDRCSLIDSDETETETETTFESTTETDPIPETTIPSNLDEENNVVAIVVSVVVIVIVIAAAVLIFLCIIRKKKLQQKEEAKSASTSTPSEREFVEGTRYMHPPSDYLSESELFDQSTTDIESYGENKPFAHI